MILYEYKHCINYRHNTYSSIIVYDINCIQKLINVLKFNKITNYKLSVLQKNIQQ